MPSFASPLLARVAALLICASMTSSQYHGSTTLPRLGRSTWRPSAVGAPALITPLRWHSRRFRSGLTGLDPSVPVAVTFSTASGYWSTLRAIRVAQDGTVVAPVPLYVDVKTGKTASATASVVLTQGSLASAPIGLTIQDIPQVSDYGTSLGAISRAFFNYQAMALGQQLGALRALQASSFNHVDTSQQQATVAKLQLAAIKSRNDIDRIVSNNALVIPIGNLSNGTPINFDRNSVTALDRVLGMYLVSMSSVFQTGINASSHGQHGRALTDETRRRVRDLGTIIKGLSSINGVNGVVASFLSAWRSNDPNDRVLAVAGGIVGVVAVGATIAAALTFEAPAVLAIATMVGIEISAASVVSDITHFANDVSVVMRDSSTPQQVTNAYNEMTNHAIDTLVDSAGVVLGDLALADQVYANFLKPATQVALQLAGFAATVTQEVVETKQEDTLRQNSLSVGNEWQVAVVCAPGIRGYSGHGRYYE